MKKLEQEKLTEDVSYYTPDKAFEYVKKQQTEKKGKEKEKKKKKAASRNQSNNNSRMAGQKFSTKEFVPV